MYRILVTRKGIILTMPDLSKPINVSSVLDAVHELNFSIFLMEVKIGQIRNLEPINMTTDFSLSYLTDLKQLKVPFGQLKGLILISYSIYLHIPFNQMSCDYLVVDDAKYLFAYIYREIGHHSPDQLLSFSERFPDCKRKCHGYISDDVRFGQNVSLGNDLIIHGGVHVFANTTIGDRVSIKPNTVLGGSGFGFAIRSGHPPLPMPHFGGVRIGNDVEIGSSTTIDRGSFGDTIISDYVKIDNGVHIAHNVSIGTRSLIIAHAEISGSVVIGNDVWISPKVSVREKVMIGDRAVVGIGSVVTKDVPADKTVYGVPAKEK